MTKTSRAGSPVYSLPSPDWVSINVKPKRRKKVRKQPKKPAPAECWCALYNGKIKPGWCADRETVRRWARDTGGPAIRVRIVPVATAKAKRRKGGK